jgi:hypothetical protein
MLAQIATGRERNEAIAEARALGARLEEIGAALGIKHERVRRICNRQAAEDPAERIAANAGIRNPAKYKERGPATDVRERKIRQSGRTSEEGS